MKAPPLDKQQWTRKRMINEPHVMQEFLRHMLSVVDENIALELSKFEAKKRQGVTLGKNWDKGWVSYPYSSNHMNAVIEMIKIRRGLLRELGFAEKEIKESATISASDRERSDSDGEGVGKD